MVTQLTNITSFADQQTTVQLADGSTFSMELIFQGATERWLMNIVYDALTINGINVCTYPNILRPWKNVLPFGLMVTTADQTDPFDINDFSTGRANLFLLDAAEVAIVESSIFGVVS